MFNGADVKLNEEKCNKDREFPKPIFLGAKLIKPQIRDCSSKNNLLITVEKGTFDIAVSI